jgi:Ca-activated chloride channel homolog
MRSSRNLSGGGVAVLFVIISLAFALSLDGVAEGGWGGILAPGDAQAQTPRIIQPAPGSVPLPDEPGSKETGDKTLSPYFFVKSDSPEVDQLPLKSTSVTVDIAGVIADVRVVQVYKNEGKRAIEAVYVFPASTKAAVNGMKMTIGERTITAQIRKREEARQAYEEAKQQGKSASLLEQQRPNVFQMNVANILPGDEIRTELHYTELLAPTEAIYQFVYPTVVGPRYSSQAASQAPPSEKWVENPHLHEKEKPPYTFDITTHLSAGIPIQQITCSSHQVDISYEDPSRATVRLAAKEEFGGNRDFILKYRLSGDRIESGLLLYDGEEEDFFLLMMQPPKRISQEQIPPREYIFIVDVSGSMHGFPLDISKRLLSDLIGKLRPTDTFNVLLFSGGSQLMAETSLPATPENIRRAVDLMDRQQGGGGTELLPALKRALALPRREGSARTLVIATDGYVTVETEVFDLIRKELGHSNFFTFGIGSSVNRYLIEGMAHVGAGEPFVITKPDEAPAQAENFRRYVLAPVLTQIKLNYEGFDVYDVEPAGVPDVFAERPVIVFGKWRGSPQGKIVLRGLTGSQAYEQTIDVGAVKPLPADSALRYLWARSRIQQLADYNHLRPDDRRVAEITDLALKYSLLSSYTSFVAIDSLVRREGGEVTTVQQPLPLPEGVSDYAVGGAAPTGLLSYSMRKSGSLPAPVARESAAGSSKGTAAVQEAESSIERQDVQRSKKAERPRVKIGKLTVGEGLPESAVKNVIDEQIEKIQSCCRKLRQRPGGSEVKLRWTIDATGRVTKAEVVSDDKKPEAGGQCLVDLIKKWCFPVPQGKNEVTVTLSLFLMESVGR